MDSQLLFGFQTAMSLLVYGLVARWYVGPTVARVNIVAALTPLLIFQATRYVGLAFLTPSVIDPDVPASFAVPGAVGDALASFLALAALWALRRGSSLALPLLWLFNVEATLDFVNAFYRGVAVGLPHYQLGAAWFIPTILVPAYFVVNIVIFGLLLARPSELRGTSRRPRLQAGKA